MSGNRVLASVAWDALGLDGVTSCKMADKMGGIGDDHAQWRANGSNSELRLADDDVAKVKLEKFKSLLLASLFV